MRPDARGPLERSRMMGTWPGWGWLLLPACQALIAPREVSGHTGQALTLHCWYAPGYQGYNKYWCRGASRDSCRKVVETAGREAPRQRGRVSITDNHVFCLVLLTLEELWEEDAGSYWCGVERAGRDIMTPVTIRVLPAPPRTTPDASVRAVPANPAAPLSPGPSDATTELLYTANITNATATGPPGSALSALVPTAVLLSLLAVAGSAGLIYALWRRREDRRPLGAVRSNPKDQAQLHHLDFGDSLPPRSNPPPTPSKPAFARELDNVYDNELDLTKDPGDTPPPRHGSSAMEQDAEPEDENFYTNTLCHDRSRGGPGRGAQRGN
ncbi:CMRF35-like molecule 2 [Oxyura jamaicensis]|uniref:CMRF35-like molecule 2 n=1 Tax=Oxyura jamaicensis TaxID=8884 RepID=UPI0015A64B9B|nr:CMRF35-like molecule 2 [Oxyura jamaicensis]